MPKHVRIRLADKCNLNCSYCSEHNNGKSLTETDIDMLIENLKEIAKYEKRNLTIFIYGGEPLLCSNLLYLLDKLQLDIIESIEIHTNLTIDIDLKILSYTNVKIASSYHLETKPNLKEIFWNNIQILAGSYQKVSEINIMISDLEKLNDLNKINETLNSYNLNSFIVPTFQLLEQYSHKKLSKILPILKPKDVNIYGLGEVNFGLVQEIYNPFGLYCNCPKDSFMINYDGGVKACQEDYHVNKDLIAKENFNIFKNNITLNELQILSNPIKCNHTRCRCEFDIKKFKNL